MVFAGQDKWRKHPLIYQCYKKPLPALGLAVGIFSVYLFVDIGFGLITGANQSNSQKSVKFTEAGDFGDAPPTAKFTKH